MAILYLLISCSSRTSSANRGLRLVTVSQESSLLHGCRAVLMCPSPTRIHESPFFQRWCLSTHGFLRGTNSGAREESQVQREVKNSPALTTLIIRHDAPSISKQNHSQSSEFGPSSKDKPGISHIARCLADTFIYDLDANTFVLYG